MTLLRMLYALTVEHCNKWESTRDIKGPVLNATVLSFHGLGAIISLESEVQSNKKVYQIIISHFPEYTCPDFLNMVIALIEKRG
jgi:hypothetical protein